MIDNTNKIIYSDIKQNLEILFKIFPENENLIKLDKATDYFKNDKEWLLIIRFWLKNLNKTVSEIKRNWQDNFSSVIKEILISVKYED